MTETNQAEFYRMISSNFSTYKNAIFRALLNIFFYELEVLFFILLVPWKLIETIGLLLGLHMTTLPKPK